MKVKPIEVKIVGQEEGSYQIKFPHLSVPVKVNEQLYYKMLHSPDYLFRSSNTGTKQSYSA